LKNILIAGDLHIDLSSLEECSNVLNEQKELIKKYNVDTYISTGDNFDNVKPTSKELDLFASFLKKINIPSIIISAQSHESETPEDSILNHFGILSNAITIVKEYHDENKLFIGHFGLKESKINKFGATHFAQEFKKFRWVVLGHFHSFEQIGKNCVQLGSSRWVDFSEAQDKIKVVLLIENYDTDNPTCHFMPLLSPIPMIDIELHQKTDSLPKNEPIKDPVEAKKVPEMNQKQAQLPIKMTDVGQLCSYLDQLPEKTKIRIIFKDYNGWLEFLPLYQKYKNKFTILRDKKDFIMSNNLVIPKNENVSLKESLIDWMEKNNVDEKIKSILLGEIK